MTPFPLSAAVLFDIVQRKINMAKAPVKVKLRGIRVPGVRMKDGKVVKSDKAPPHVKAGRVRKKNKITGVRAVR